MSSESSTFLETVKNKPVISSLCAAFAPVAIVTGNVFPVESDLGLNVMSGFLYAAPVTCAVGAGIGAMNVFRNKSLISKPFSLLAVGAGVLPILLWRLSVNDNDPVVIQALTAVFAMAGTSAAGVSNLVSHVTRDIGPKIGVVKPNEPSA